MGINDNNIEAKLTLK